LTGAPNWVLIEARESTMVYSYLSNCGREWLEIHQPDAGAHIGRIPGAMPTGRSARAQVGLTSDVTVSDGKGHAKRDG
jgi:hypothetical protein